MIEITFLIVIIGVMILSIDFVREASGRLLKPVLLDFDLLVIVKIIVLNQIDFFISINGKVSVSKRSISIFSCVLICYCRRKVTALVFVDLSDLVGY